MTESGTCDCRSGGGGYRYNPELDLWVHAECNRPTKQYLDAMYRLATGEQDG